MDLVAPPQGKLLKAPPVQEDRQATVQQATVQQATVQQATVQQDSGQRAGVRLSGEERHLSDAADRALRMPHGKLVLVLHLSRHPAPRDHHLRVARVLLQDTAQRHGGQVFTMRNRDLVLLCNDAAPDQAGQPHAPAGLPDSLLRLFAADVADAAGLTSLWELDQDPAPLLDYLASRACAAVPEDRKACARDQPVSLAALQEIVAKIPVAALTVHQTGLSLSPDRSRTVEARLAPAFQAISIALDGLSLSPLVVHAVGDPFLFRHFMAVLDTRLMQLLQDDLAGHGRQISGAASQGTPILVELGLRTIVSPAFANLARLIAGAGVRLWVAVPLLEAAANLDLLDHARGVLALVGCSLVINHVDPGSLGIVRLAALQPDVLVLAWSAELRVAVDHGADPAAVRPWLPARGSAAPVPRVILADADGEQALAWGQSHDISLFQGPYPDRVQAAARMQRCHSAAACSVRQCVSRAAALTQAGRVGCANPALLDAGFGMPR